MRRTPVLNRRLVLEATERVPDGAGGFVETWGALGVLWAQITPRTGGERAGEELTLSRVPYTIVVRGAPPGAARRPEPGERFREGPRVFNIRAVTEADRHGQYLTCFADEEIPA
ncbi:head-tail adaptor protein [Rhodovulum euryhalinum]|uniref:Head-tail adaptor n=1 Tax=Rhodovulum euryhalinum TaxID=35805 RepID=A0A4R2KDB0_9RHOB|nr:head-tail adaptor protein [Rhodovulum euryhalinum]TCO70914.1 head-tail adaptor [Rhodovulum euryhalinum]